METEIATKEQVKRSRENDSRQEKQAAPGKILEAYLNHSLDNIPVAEKEEAVEEIVRTPKGAQPSDADTAETPADLPYEERVQAEGELISSLIREQFDQCKTSGELEEYLHTICEQYHLQAGELVGLGTPDFHIRFRVNPWFEVSQPSGAKIYYMEGRALTPITKVWWKPGTLQLGATSMPVGRHMIANPLAPDAEAGSDTGTDTEQGVLSDILAYRGATRKDHYIKGHLLNDNVGGPGLAFNLYPITEEANHQHLIAFEKFVKAELHKHYVLYYEVQVQDEAIRAATTAGKFIVDSKFHCIWYLLNATGTQIGAKHEGDILSTFGVQKPYPFEVKTEYAGLFDTLDHSNFTPVANPMPGAREEKGSSILRPSKFAPTIGALPDGKTVPNIFAPPSTQTTPAPPPPTVAALPIQTPRPTIFPPPTQDQIDRSAEFERLGWLDWDDDDLFRDETSEDFWSSQMSQKEEPEEGIDDHFEDFQ